MFEWLKRKLKKEEVEAEESVLPGEEASESEPSEETEEGPSQWEQQEQEELPEEVEELSQPEDSAPFDEPVVEEMIAQEEDSFDGGLEEEGEPLEGEEEPIPEIDEAHEDETEPSLESVTEELQETILEEELPVEEEVVKEELPQVEEPAKVDTLAEEELSHGDILEENEDETSEEAPTEEGQSEEPEEKTSLFQRLKRGLTKTRDDVGHKINQVLGVYVKIDDEMMEDLEEVLVTSDIGVSTTMEIVESLEEAITREKVRDPQEVKPLMKRVILELMEEDAPDYDLHLEPSPAVILVIGVNGVGKTTTIGKLSHRLQREGKSVLVAAADTFRAAAIDQLKTWGQRAGVDVIAHSEGADPTAVVYDGIQAAKARGADVLICDTAGRLHNKKNLMQELEKINRIIDREYGEATRETLLVLDATTGQNAMIQAKTFTEAAQITGIVLTKLDGTAKGGVVIALQRELKIPIKLVGIGEGIDDLQPFDGRDFVEALF